MANSPNRSFPTAIVATISILLFGSIFDFGVGLRILFNSEVQIGTTLPTWYLLTNAVMSMVLGIFYLWLIRMLMTKHPTARILTISVAFANSIFSLTRLPAGLVSLALNIVVIALIAAPRTRDWLAS